MATTTRSPTPQSPRSVLPSIALLGNTAQPTSPAPPTLGNTTLPTINEDSVLLKPSDPKSISSPTSAQLRPFSSTEVSSPELSSKSTLLSPRRSPAPLLTGAAAMADAKRKRQADFPSRETTPNPGVVAMQRLMGDTGMSKASDAPAPNKLSEPLRLAAEKIQIPDQDASGGNSVQTSPVSLSSFGTTDLMNGSGTLTATSTEGTDTISAPFVAEPAEMNEQGTSADAVSSASAAEEPSESNKAFSYPGLPAQPQQQNDTPPVARGMSFPGINRTDSTGKSSPSMKRHKCPYCSTDFTRHHNLKSHLLTHSQEKPYVCSTCQSRFRRLHDLKRHTKLHTGERPHTCDKCGRRFARGDALARHSKGPGGCAGRRSSFGGDDDLADGMGDGMEGIEYTNDEDEEGGTSDLSRRVSEPSRKRLQVETPHDSARTIYRQPSSTYPPTQHRPGDMGPPAALHNNHNGNNATSPRDSHASAPTISTGYFQNYNQGGLIESPKPISPGQPPDQHRLSVDAGSAGAFGRNRSPSLTTQFQQTHFGRGSGGRTPPQPPQSQFSSTNHLSAAGNNQLPPLTLSTSSLRRPSLTGPGHSMLHQQHPPQNNSVSNPTSASSHGQSSGSSMREILGTGPGGLGSGGESEMWQHLRQLEGKFVRMQDEYELRISRLQEEVISLRSQLTNSQTGGPAGSYPGEPRY